MKLKKFLYKNARGFTFLPTAFVVNIINICDRKCSFCPYHSPFLADNYHTNWFQGQPDFLKYKDFEKFVKRLRKVRFMVKSISLTGKGEPFLHPDLDKFCNLLEEEKIHFTITTNGIYPQKILHFAQEYDYLDAVRVSLYDKKTVKIFRDFPKLKNVDYFNMTSFDVDYATPGYIAPQYGIKHKRSLPQDFNKGDYCPAAFSFLTINSDGKIVPCYSFDETGHITDSLWKIFNGKLVRRYRHQAVNGRNMEFADCDNCGINMQ